MSTLARSLRRLVVRALPLLALGLFATSARAQISGVPDPRNSTIPGCIGVCPAGDLGFTVTVRDVTNAPVSGSTVVLQVGSGFGQGCASPVIHVCADCVEASGYDPVAKSFARVSDVNGVASFHLCASLMCPAGGTRWAALVANGVVLGNVAVFNTDLDADGDVDAADVALETAATSSPYSSANDEDCNGVVNATDIALVNAHLGHVCAERTPTLPSSWGTVKATYR
jgi:hypothetical protein